MKYLFGLPIIASLLLIATLPPFNHGFFIFIAFIPFLIFLERARARLHFVRAAWWGSVLAGLPYTAWSLWPLVSARAWWWVGQYSFLWKNKELLLAIFLLVVALLTGALLFFIFALGYQGIRSFKVRGRALPLVAQALILGVVWALLEYVRMLALGGIVWQEFAFALAPYASLREFFSAFGLYGTEVALIVINCVGAWWLCTLVPAHIDSAREWSHRISRAAQRLFVAVLGAAAAWAVVTAGGIYMERLEQKHAAPSIPFVPVRVAAVQASFGTEDAFGLTAQRFYEKTVRSLGPSDLIILPENALPYFVIDEKTGKPIVSNEVSRATVDQWYEEFMKITKERPLTTFVIGFHSKISEQTFNTLFLIQNGRILDSYHKRYLLPLSELSPNIGPLRSLEPLSVGARGFGGESAFVSTFGTLWPLICSEVFNMHTWDKRAYVGDFYMGRFDSTNASSAAVTMPLPVSMAPRVTVYSGNETVFASALVADRIKAVSQMRAAYEKTFIISSVKGREARVIDPTGAIRVVSGGTNVATTTLWLPAR